MSGHACPNGRSPHPRRLPLLYPGALPGAGSVAAARRESCSGRRQPQLPRALPGPRAFSRQSLGPSPRWPVTTTPPAAALSPAENQRLSPLPVAPERSQGLAGAGFALLVALLGKLRDRELDF